MDNKIRKRRPGGGRPKLLPEERKVFTSTTISGDPLEIKALKKVAEKSKKSVSRWILDHPIIQEYFSELKGDK